MLSRIVPERGQGRIAKRNLVRRAWDQDGVAAVSSARNGEAEQLRQILGFVKAACHGKPAASIPQGTAVEG
jgi:hypothetical protein